MGTMVMYDPVKKVIPQPVKKETTHPKINLSQRPELIGDVEYVPTKDTIKPEEFFMGDIYIAPVKKSVLDDTVMLQEVIVTTSLTSTRKETTMGLSVVKGESIMKLQQPDSLFKKIIKKIFPGSFRVYPNPAKGDAVLNIEWKQEESGNFLLHLLTMSGQLVYTKEMYIDADARLLDLQLPSVTPGTYFLRISNKQSGNNFTEKIVIQ
jgi:hypothetical protein